MTIFARLTAHRRGEIATTGGPQLTLRGRHQCRKVRLRRWRVSKVGVGESGEMLQQVLAQCLYAGPAQA